MELRIGKEDWLFFIVSLAVGILAEQAFMHGELGISYFVFIAVFYSVFFWRFRGFPYRNQRLGWLILGAIWILAACYFLYDTSVFYILNSVVIPVLVLFHIGLITGPKELQWARPVFITYLGKRIADSIDYAARFSGFSARLALHRSTGKNAAVVKKVLIGLGISIPVLALVLNLLIAADSQFKRIVSGFPDWFSFDVPTFIHIILSLFFALAIFGFMQVHLKRRMELSPPAENEKKGWLDPVIALTVLFLLDAVYVLFVAVQFTYFFSGTLGDGYTYAEYARRGFFELVIVSLINLTVTVIVLSFAKEMGGAMKKITQAALSVLVLSSGVILASAFMRLMMYEEAYGFTFTRVLVHGFMIFLLVILLYTLAKIWLERLSLFHFYFIAAVVFYTGLNAVNIDQIVVDRNLERYQKTGKIDLEYLAYMSDTGIIALLDLFKDKPEIPGLKTLLGDRKEELKYEQDNWQSYNLTRAKVREELLKLALE